MQYVHSPALRGHWYPVAEVADLLDGPRRVTLLGESYVLWSADGEVAAAPDRCPHREAPLSIGSVDDASVLRCAYHGWGFALDGRCVDVPSSGPGTAVPPTAHLPCVPVAVRYGLVWMCPGEPVGTIPEIVQDADPAFRRINTGVEAWQVSATRMVDNFLDISHFPWVHTGTFGAGQPTRVERLELGPLDDDFFGYAYEVDANNPDEAVVATGTEDTVVHRHMTTGFSLPLLVRSTIRYEDGLEHILLLVSTPVDDDRSLFTFVVWRNDDHDVDAETVIAFDRAIGREDQEMLEHLPGPLPLDRADLVSVQSDKPSVEWRRRFRELITDPI